VIPTSEETVLLSVDRLVEESAWPLSRSATYDAIRRGELPTVRIGRRLFIPTAQLRQLLGLDTLAVTRDEPPGATGDSLADLMDAAKHPKRSPS
jgi:hypothetical protein